MTAALSLSQRLYGTDQDVVPSVEASVGVLSFLVEGPQLRVLKHEGREILRSVGLVIRDEFWGTLALQQHTGETQVTDLQWQQHCSGNVERAGQGAVLDWQVNLQVTAHGLTITARLQALQDFMICRAGLMLLHPLAGVVNAAVSVTHNDGRVEQSVFPDLIAPAQPFLDIQRLVHSPVPGLSLQWTFSGDVFEMEDQRNWGDASFKTYNRPLAWPCPYRLAKGEQVEQSITLLLLSDTSGRS